MARARYAVGEVVLVPFAVPGRQPASFRIALILHLWPWSQRTTHYLLCFIDTQSSTDPYEIRISAAELGVDSPHEFHIRPTYLLTVAESRIEAQVGKLGNDKVKLTLDALFDALYEEIEGSEP